VCVVCVCVECLIGKQKETCHGLVGEQNKPTLFKVKVTEPSSYRHGTELLPRAPKGRRVCVCSVFNDWKTVTTRLGDLKENWFLLFSN